MCIEKAIGYFDGAYRGFEKNHHLKGMHLAKKSKLNLLFLVDSRAEETLKTVMDVGKLQKSYRNYRTDVGLDNSCYIPREHGEDVSLLTELVLQQ